jgi:hypothetical protein
LTERGFKNKNIMTITCPVNDSSGVCSTMEGAGAGLGKKINCP